MNTRFRHTFWVTSACHVGLVLVLMAVPFLWGLFQHRKSPPAFFVTLATPSPPAVALDSPPSPDQEPEPEPEPAPPPPRPTRVPIEVNQNRIRRQPQEQPPRPQPTLTPQQIREQLAQGLPTGPPTLSDLPAWYFALVRKKMYEAWQQPGELSGLTGLSALVEIRVEKSGQISRCRLVTPSGNSIMDRSVELAARSVTRIEALPSSVQGRYKDISIEFELTL